MGIIVNQQSKRSELQEKITAELRAKQRGESLVAPDLGTPHTASDDEKTARRDDLPTADIEHSEFLRGTKTTTSLAWVWALVGAAALAGTIWAVIGLTG